LHYALLRAFALNALSAFPSCRRKSGLFGLVVAQNARGVKSGVHYIAFGLFHAQTAQNNPGISKSSDGMLLDGFCCHWGPELGVYH
jgi:hypothetical protein